MRRRGVNRPSGLHLPAVMERTREPGNPRDSVCLTGGVVRVYHITMPVNTFGTASGTGESGFFDTRPRRSAPKYPCVFSDT